MAEIEMILHGVDTSVGTYLAWESARCAPQFTVVMREQIQEVSDRLSRSLPGSYRGSDAAETGVASGGPHIPHKDGVPRGGIGSGGFASEESTAEEGGAFTEGETLTAGLPFRLGPTGGRELLRLLRGGLVEPKAYRTLMVDIARTLQLEPFIESLRQEILAAPEGDLVLLAVNPPPSCGQVPWELLPTGATTDDGHDEVLLDLVDVVTMAPILTRDARPGAVHPQWRPGPGIYLVQPWGRAGKGHVATVAAAGEQAVLSAASLQAWDEQVAGLEDGSIAPQGGRADRIWLSDVLRAGAAPGSGGGSGGFDDRGTRAFTRLLYVGHMAGSGSNSRLRLDDDQDVFGLAEVDAAGVRWFSAADLYQGTTPWREEKYRHLGLTRQRGNDGPAVRTVPKSTGGEDAAPGGGLGTRFPACVEVTGSGDEEQVAPLTGAELWPMPPRVGLVACVSGGETRSMEPFGLATSCLEAGAELVFATRWTMLTDLSFSCMGLIKPPSTAKRPFDELAHAVDGFLQAEDPVHEMSEWKRLRLGEWRANPGDPGNAPISWAGLTAFWAPDRSTGEPTIP